ncbi:MAG: hypothetical protein GYA45_04640 [Pelolinea sp.]|nr:hypothetical protein [Pelolinea sp.]
MKQPVEEFLNSVTGERKDLLLELQALTRTLYPQAGCLIWYNLFAHRILTVGLAWAIGKTDHQGTPNRAHPQKRIAVSWDTKSIQR